MRRPPLRKYARMLTSLIRRYRPGRLQAHTSEFSNLFPENATIERLASGFQFTEGPVWLPREQALLFTDIPANKILKYQADGQITCFRQPSGHANGQTLDIKGRLVTCEHSTRRVTRTDEQGRIEVLADRFQGLPLNSPNDVVSRSDGTLYFTDPPYGINPGQQQQPMQAVFKLSSEGELSVVADDFLGPNGLAFSPDESRLYVDDSSAHRHIRVFDVQPNGDLCNSRLFADMRVKEPGSPDGMKVDKAGRIFCTGARGVWVFDPQGVHMGTIRTPEKPANCAWGDPDFKSLYVTAQSSLYRVRVNTAGIALAASQ